MTEPEALALIFQADVSTSPIITQLSGRGRSSPSHCAGKDRKTGRSGFGGKPTPHRNHHSHPFARCDGHVSGHPGRSGETAIHCADRAGGTGAALQVGGHSIGRRPRNPVLGWPRRFPGSDGIQTLDQGLRWNAWATRIDGIPAVIILGAEDHRVAFAVDAVLFEEQEVCW